FTRSLLVKGVVLAVINIAIINIGFLFYKTGQSFSEYVFVSKMFNAVQHHAGIFAHIPLPLPSPFIYGLDTVKYFDEFGGGFTESSFGLVSILGHAEQGKSYWFYYVVTFLFKTPLPVLLFFIITCIHLFKKSNRSFFIRNEMILLFAFFYLLMVMSFFNHIQAGVRHIIF